MILVDSNTLVAMANDRDNNHKAARELLETVPGRLTVAPTVTAEVCYLLHERAGASAEVKFLRGFSTGELRLADLTLSDLRRMWPRRRLHFKEQELQPASREPAVSLHR